MYVLTHMDVPWTLESNIVVDLRQIDMLVIFEVLTWGENSQGSLVNGLYKFIQTLTGCYHFCGMWHVACGGVTSGHLFTWEDNMY